MRSYRTRTAIAVLVALFGSAVSLLWAEPAVAAPAVSAAPSTGLASGRTTSVSVTGFPAGAPALRVVRPDYSVTYPAAYPTVVHWRTIGGTAGPDDFIAAEGDVVIAPDTVTALVPIRIRGDVRNEDDEVVVLAFSDGVNTDGGYLGLGVGIIVDDD